MSRLASWLVVALALAGAAFVAATSGALPARVASHFASGGTANGWMPREAYTWFMMLLCLLLPLVLLAALAWLPARHERWINLPHRDHWMAPARRSATLDSLRAFGAAIGAAAALFTMALHALIVDANARTPARLDETLFFAVLAAFLLVVAGGTIALTRRFRNVPRSR